MTFSSNKLINTIEYYMNKIVASFKRNRKIILICLAATFVWGLIAHSYIFLHSSFTHDALKEFNAGMLGNDIKIQSGRVFVPVYRFLVREYITIPWLIGILSLFYIGIAVILTVKLFNIRSTLFMVVVAGVFTVNNTFTATAATYIHDLDCDFLAFLLSVLSVYLWKKYDKGFIYGMIPLCISMGLYQSYICVAITLVMIYTIMQLLDGECFDMSFKNGLRSIVMFVGAGLLYYVSIRGICAITGIALSSGKNNSLDAALSKPIPQLLFLVVKGYAVTCVNIITVPNAYPRLFIIVATLVLIIIAGTIILKRVFSRDIKIKEKLLILFLILLLPLGMNIIYAVAGGVSHVLMKFALWLTYVFVLLVIYWAIDNSTKFILKISRFVCVSLILTIVWGNVRTANATYLKKDLDHQANLSLFTRVLYSMENYDGYITGKTPVVIIGEPKNILDYTIPGFNQAYSVIEYQSSFAQLYPNLTERYQTYFDYILLNPANIADQDTWNKMLLDNRVKSMSNYPDKGSVSIIDGIMVVKLGD